MKYSPYLKVLLDADDDASRKKDAHDCLFTLQLSATDTHVFMTPSTYQRDIIVLTIKAFNAGCFVV